MTSFSIRFNKTAANPRGIQLTTWTMKTSRQCRCGAQQPQGLQYKCLRLTNITLEISSFTPYSSLSQ